jgi:hypothetical protein
MRLCAAGVGQPAADCRISGLGSVHRSGGWKAQRQRNHRRCLFITIRPALAGATNHEAAHGTEEKPEAMRPRNRHKREGAVGVGDKPTSAEFGSVEETPKMPRFACRNVLSAGCSLTLGFTPETSDKASLRGHKPLARGRVTKEFSSGSASNPGTNRARSAPRPMKPSSIVRGSARTARVPIC